MFNDSHPRAQTVTCSPKVAYSNISAEPPSGVEGLLVLQAFVKLVDKLKLAIHSPAPASDKRDFGTCSVNTKISSRWN